MAKRIPGSKKSIRRKLTEQHARTSANGKRFYTAQDMAIVQRDQQHRNSQIRRGVVVPAGQNHYIAHCGCGARGCFIHGSFASTNQT